MKIGVYGDSFAGYHPNKETTEIAWYTVLASLIPGSTVKTYGLGNTSVFYSYKKFLETHTEFDQIIFLVTEPDRYTKILEFSNGKKESFSNLQQVEGRLANPEKLSNPDKKIIDDLRGWFMSVDSEYNQLSTELMLRDMEKLRNNILFFPCFLSSCVQERLVKQQLSEDMNMMHIVEKQVGLLGLARPWSMFEILERVSCHLTQEFNLFVADLFADKILNNHWHWSEINNVKLNHDLDYYYSHTPRQPYQRKKYEQTTIRS